MRGDRMTASRKPEDECRDKLLAYSVRAHETCRIHDGVSFLLSPVYRKKCREASQQAFDQAEECLKLHNP